VGSDSGGGGQVADERGALDITRELKATGPLDDVAARLAERLLALGIEGKQTFSSAAEVADRALLSASGDVERAVDAVVKKHVVLAGGSGFLTSAGGFVTLPVALPANVLGFYVVATRMTAAVARLRGHDIAAPQVRTAVLLALVGADADAVLRKAGAIVPSGRMVSVAVQRLPGPALMMVNKGIAFRILATAGRSGLARLGKLVPVVGGVIGGGLDGWMMTRIAAHARSEFPGQVRGRIDPA
jgi:hypothetical protein